MRCTHKCNPAAVGSPGVDVDGALAAKELEQQAGGTAGGRHQAQFHVFVRQVFVGLQIARVIGNVNHMLPVGGNVRKPGVDLRVEGHLFLCRAVGAHAPELHQTGADRVEPDVFSARGVLGTVVQAGSIGQAGFRATAGAMVYIVLPVPLGTIGSVCLSGSSRAGNSDRGGYQPRLTSFKGDNVYA